MFKKHHISSHHFGMVTITRNEAQSLNYIGIETNGVGRGVAYSECPSIEIFRQEISFWYIKARF